MAATCTRPLPMSGSRAMLRPAGRGCRAPNVPASRQEFMSVSRDSASQEAAFHKPAPPVDQATLRAIIVGIILAMFLSALEQTIVAPALPTIGRSLGDVENLSWVMTSYLLCATVATPLFGKLSDIYGRRTMMLTSISIFLLGSAACALAPTVWALVLARALQGLGGGGILPLAQTVIADLLSPRERPVVQSYSSVMFMSASILGPVMGGFLTDYIHWSMIFWINLPLGAVALVMTSRALRLLPRNDRPHRLDFQGAALMVVASIALLLALGWGGSRYSWTSAPILGLFAASALVWLAFVRRLITAPEPLIPLDMVREPLIGAIVAAGFFGIGTIVGLSIFVPLYIQLVLNESASASGLVLIAFLAGATIGSLVAGRLISKLDRYKRVPVAALPLGVVALAIFALSPARFSVVEVAALLAIGGLGMGTLYPATTVIIQNAVLPHQMGIATGTLNFFRQLGGAIVVAIFGAIVIGGIDAGPNHAATFEGLSGGEADFAASFRWVFVAAAGFLAAAFIAILLIEERPLRGPSSGQQPPARPASEPLAAE
jgi:EmrB/QacA subfamily drug resistance transporter